MPEIEEKPEPEVKKDPVEEMLLSPTLQHRNQEIEFSPFDPDKNVKNQMKQENMQRINLFGFNLLSVTPKQE